MCLSAKWDGVASIQTDTLRLSWLVCFGLEPFAPGVLLPFARGCGRVRDYGMMERGDEGRLAVFGWARNAIIDNS